MKELTKGIHHITAIVGDPNENIYFYQHILGLRLIKQTVNFDDPTTYHLYFGDHVGTPGSVITFFPMPNANQGIIGGGQVGITYYAIPKGSIPFWKNRLDQFHIVTNEEFRFGKKLLSFTDVHGLKLSLVEVEDGLSNYASKEISNEVAIIGFFGATIQSYQIEATKSLLSNVFGMKYVGEDDEYIRYQSSATIGSIIDIKKKQSKKGSMGIGVVHHIAMRASDDIDHIHMMNEIRKNGYTTTNVIDRNYFHSIYFRERGGVLFEVATDNPGFLVDEDLDTLGTNLKLPKQYEPFREQIKRSLPKLEVTI